MSTVRNILRNSGIRPSKRLGQSFLEDKNIISKIIMAADIREDDVVVEIGAGLGIMTQLLAEKAKRVIAIDIDPRMIIILQQRFPDWPNVDVVEKDILSFDFAALADSAPVNLKVIGNIPYNISSQILFHIIKYRHFISSAVLLFQKEVVDRITASPGTKDYGIPSVIVAMYAVASREMNIPASCFYPEPKVTSSLVKILMRKSPLVRLEDEDCFLKTVKIAFSKRRKTILNNLRSSYSLNAVTTLLDQLGIDGNRRGETLSIEEFGRLSNALYHVNNI
jgi:16S rRNA (adenine1518-N6/adenine1519-N6)-dimethyltransferase